MRRLRRVGFILLIMAALLVLPSCWVMSVYPLYENDDRQPVDPGLAGQWWQPEADCRLSITVAPTWTHQQQFTLEYSVPEKGTAKEGCVLDEGQGPVKLQGRLVDLEGRLFLDLLPSEVRDDFQVLPVHSIFRITVRNDELDIVPLHPEFVEKAIRDGKIQGLKDDPIITAPTAEWRKFVLSVVDDVSAFPEVAKDRRFWHFTRMPAGLTPRKAPPKPACPQEHSE